MRRRQLIVIGLVVALGVAVWGVMRSPWRHLQAVYGASFPTETMMARATVSVTGASRAAWVTYREAVGVRFLDDGVELWQRPPMGLVYRPFRLPLSAVGRCGVFQRAAPTRVTGLWLEREAQWLGFESGWDTALTWCRDRGLPIDEAVN